MDPFEVRLTAAARRYNWERDLVDSLRAQRAQLEADPDVILRVLVRKFSLSVNDEVAVRTLAEAAIAAPPPPTQPRQTVWEPSDKVLVPEDDATVPPPRPLTPMVPSGISDTPGDVAARLVKGDTLATRMRDPWSHSLHRVMLALADMVAHAHAAGFVVRNLSPQNIVIGPLGEAVVRDPSAEPTPAYCSPEQTQDWTAPLTPRSDVFSLGSILFEACTGHSLFGRVGTQDTLDAIETGERRQIDADLPPSLLALCTKATQADPEDRFATAAELARALRSVGTSQPETLDTAMVLAEAAKNKAREAEVLSETSQFALAGLSPSAPLEARQPVWREIEKANALTEEAEALAAASLAELQVAALANPGDSQVQLALAQHYKQQHEKGGPGSDGLLRLIRKYDADGRFAAYVEGLGTLSLRTKPATSVDLYRYEARDFRLWPTPVRSLGKTPLNNIELPSGSYVALLRTASGTEVRYPILIRRQTHWHGVPPNAKRPIALGMPRGADLSEDEVFVPGGWFKVGANTGVCLPAGWVWRHAFSITKHPVTMGEYATFLTQQRAATSEATVRPWLPLEPHAGSTPWPTVAWTGRRYEVRAMGARSLWQKDWPAAGVPLAGARAFASWKSEQTGKAWRLPRELEWEKAARGVDGRRFPWGDHADRLFARYGTDRPSTLDAFPADSSPYGIRGLAGNIRDWVEPHKPTPAGFGLARGGCFASTAEGLELARQTLVHVSGSPQVGFRLARNPGRVSS